MLGDSAHLATSQRHFGSGLCIGQFRLETPFLLCPLAGFTDLSFRQMIRPLGGLGMAYTELLSPKGLKSQSARSLQIAETAPDDQPLVVQLYGTDIDELCDAAVWAAERGSPLVDINMGCPVPKIAGKGGGSGLLRSCVNAVALAAAVVEKCPVPVTVKTRLGWELGNLVAPQLARALEDVGVAAVTIHGRFGEQKFSGSCDWSGIARVVEQVKKIPVIGNGDIRSAHDALAMMRETGCQGVMIGRHALANPWIFRQTEALLRTGIELAPPSRRERLDRMILHFRLMVDRLGSQRGVIEFRKRISWWAKCLAPCPNLRRLGPRIASPQDFYNLTEEYQSALESFRDDPPMWLEDGPSSMR
jgi:nifR3 family TIM-barrel protein